MQDATFLFTDIEGSTRLWEQEPERMRPALARHDAIAREAVESHGGRVVKMTGDGVHAVFPRSASAIEAAVRLQVGLADPSVTDGIPLPVRCGLHCGPAEERDGDYYGSVVNRAARIMSAAHGGQVLLSQSVAARLHAALPDGVALRDLGLVRLRDLATAEHLFQVSHPALRQDFPALRSLERTPNNLPHAITPFIGRERDRALALARVRGNRLVTLAGMGGVGKSRLAAHVAADLVEEFPDGVWFIELAPLREAERIAESIAIVLAVRPEAGGTFEDALVRHLKDRRTLLVLDNCEHLVAACAALSRRLLETAANLRILVASREAMQISGESVIGLAPLPVPGPRVAGEPVAMRQYDSVNLFVERAQAAQSEFQLTRENAVAVASICNRLDGIPLALELAAARVRGMDVEQIALRLKNRFRLLTSADPTVLPRQRTLRALMDWSHELLSPAEQDLFAQLAVFAGGWTLEACESVCTLSGGDDEDLAALLSRLVERSLVVLEQDPARYRLLETVRQYAEERLDATRGSDVIRGRHFRHYAQLAHSARPALLGPEQGRWLLRLDAERENLLAALHWSRDAAQPAEAALEMLNGLKHYWINRGLLETGQHETQSALARLASADPDMARCRALFEIGQYACYRGRYDEARMVLEESLGMARALRKDGAVAGVLQPLGLAAMAQGDLAAAGLYLAEGLRLKESQGEERGIAAAANELGQLERMRGNMPAARMLYERCLEIAARLRDDETIAIAALNLASVAIMEGDEQAASAQLLRAIEIAQALGSRRMAQSSLEVAAALACKLGDLHPGARFLGAVDQHAAITGLGREPADEAFLAPIAAMTHQRLGTAYRAVFEEGRSLPVERALQEASSWLAARTCLRSA